jgi:hypothetical protein
LYCPRAARFKARCCARPSCWDGSGINIDRAGKRAAQASPWQNGFAERLIGSIRRECVDHFIVLGGAHLRRIL